MMMENASQKTKTRGQEDERKLQELLGERRWLLGFIRPSEEAPSLFIESVLMQ